MHNLTFSLFTLRIDFEYDFKEQSRKIEDEHRVRVGQRYVYQWGSFDRFEGSVMYVNSAFKSIVNSWWRSNAKLLFVESGGVVVSSVQLVNRDQPIGEFIRPYTDLFHGKIELETY